MKKQVALPGLMLFAIVFTGCSRVDSEQPAAKKPPPGSVLLRGAGATFPSLLYEKWFAQYQQLHPEVFITYDAVGSGAGVERFIGGGAEAEKQVEFGASDTAMSDAEMVKVPRGVRLIPMTASGIALAYNIPGLRGELKLSREAYIGIFLGKIRNWNDPVIRRCNPDLQLPKTTIAVVTRRDSSGTTFAFTKHLDAVSPEWSRKYVAANFVDFPCGPMRAKGNEGVLYQNYDYPEKAEAVKGLFGWCLEAGQTFSRDLGYVPLAPKMVNQASAALKTIRP